MTLSVLRRLVAALAFLLVLGGCTHMIPVVPSSSGLSSANKIPADVGLILADDLKRYQVTEGRMGDTWSYPNLGQASAEHFRNYLESRFRKVTVISTSGSSQATSQAFAAMFEPRIDGFTFDIPITKFQVYPATIRYSVSVYGPTKQVIYKNSISGVGDTAGSPGFDFSANPSKSASKAVEEGVRLSVEDVLKAPAVRAVLGGPQGTKDSKDL